jgi:hypothetical protein
MRWDTFEHKVHLGLGDDALRMRKTVPPPEEQHDIPHRQLVQRGRPITELRRGEDQQERLWIFTLIVSTSVLFF